MMNYWHSVILLKLSTLSGAALPSYLRQEVKYISLNCRIMLVARVILRLGIWSRHTFNSSVIVTSAMQSSATQEVSIISSESSALSSNWDTALAWKGCAHLLNCKHSSLLNPFPWYFLLKAGSLLNLLVLRVEEKLVHRMLKHPVVN